MNTFREPLFYGWKTRRAWWFTATSRSKERFARTTLGSFWLGLSNLLSLAVLAVVYGTVFKVSNFKAYVVYLGIGLVLWNTIAGSVQSAPTLFRSNSGNIKNTNKHPVFYTLEEWSFQVQTFAQSFALVLLGLSYFQHSLFINLFTVGVAPLANILLFIYWAPVILCLIGAEFEDLMQLVPIVLQLMFLLSPVLYPKSSLGPIGWIADWNPLYRYLSVFRHALIEGELKLWQTVALLFINLAGTAVALKLVEAKRYKLPFLV